MMAVTLTEGDQHWYLFQKTNHIFFRNFEENPPKNVSKNAKFSACGGLMEKTAFIINNKVPCL